MSEVEKKDSQKTVVAFITGLLVGGLLVWVFSSSPADKKPAVTVTETGSEVTSSTTNTATSEVSSDGDTDGKKAAVVVGNGSIKVADQKAGKIVTLGALTLPTKSGWVVVRDFMDGIPANILGAARFSSDEGLIPTVVELMRETTVGSTYQVSFYTNEGGAGFSVSEDKMIEGIATTFKAN